MEASCGDLSRVFLDNNADLWTVWKKCINDGCAQDNIWNLRNIKELEAF